MFLRVRLALLTLLLPFYFLAAEVKDTFQIIPSFNDYEKVLIEHGWKMKAGDDSSWAKTDFDDSSWDTP